ncbi:MAG: hypothetical protein M3120_01395, partial [Pseudomonadota bacterium]|nr:hypothetical protein [Pseudomonadota bacterium]
DEIVLEAQTDEAEAARDLLERSMLDGMAYYVRRVPIKVESAVGPHWGVKADHSRTWYPQKEE